MGVAYFEALFWSFYPSGRAGQGVRLRPLISWDYGSEPRRGHGRLSLVIVVCCQVEVSASG